ncbi:unnamed protein product [Effrenium voratum]|uniref:GH3 middle domain-containing protein n=1 Tax=Effrenium voratum TaxID=2562239 RepID=A0AA36MQU6_9DINO|nr:unnamed protein product [Effrenium voratum]CAJ1459684.1 unnamed protein product [Effrenium voratum]
MSTFLGRLTRVTTAAATGLVLYDVGNREWSTRHTWSSAVKQYAVLALLKLWGAWRLRQLCSDAQRGDEVQRRLLTAILQGHQNTAFAERHGLQGVVTYDIFRESHPLTSRDVPSEGEEPDASSVFFERGFLPAAGVLSLFFPKCLEELQRLAVLPGRTFVGTTWVEAKRLDFLCTSPLAAFDLHDRDQRYAHTLFSLKERRLPLILAGSALDVKALLDTAFEHRRHLVQDIRNGHLWDRCLPEERPSPELFGSLDQGLGGPDSRRSLELDRPLKRHAAQELWPQMQVVTVLDVDEEAKEHLRSSLGVPVFSPLYAIPEGPLGVNVFPEEPFGTWTYLLDPGSAFFELLPPEAEADSRPIPAWEAQVGACYELVVTNRSLCRCRLGEVLRVHAMFGKMPVVSLERKRERTDAGASSLLLTFGLQLSYALVQRS